MADITTTNKLHELATYEQDSLEPSPESAYLLNMSGGDESAEEYFTRAETYVERFPERLYPPSYSRSLYRADLVGVPFVICSDVRFCSTREGVNKQGGKVPSKPAVQFYVRILDDGNASARQLATLTGSYILKQVHNHYTQGQVPDLLGVALTLWYDDDLMTASGEPALRIKHYVRSRDAVGAQTLVRPDDESALAADPIGPSAPLSPNAAAKAVQKRMQEIADAGGPVKPTHK